MRTRPLIYSQMVEFAFPRIRRANYVSPQQKFAITASISRDEFFQIKRVWKHRLEWIALNKRFEEDWLDTGLSAGAGPNNAILLGVDAINNLQQVAS